MLIEEARWSLGIVYRYVYVHAPNLGNLKNNVNHKFVRISNKDIIVDRVNGKIAKKEVYLQIGPVVTQRWKRYLETEEKSKQTNSKFISILA